MTHRMLLFVLFAALSGSAAMADPPGVFPYAVKTERLENGLTVVMIPMPSNGLVSYYSIVRTGSRDEYEPGHTGFAHFFEHMMFRGTKTYPAAAYDRAITAMGADANAYTTDDYTCYHLAFTAEDLGTVITLEADRFQNLWYEEPAFQTEAGAVYGEYRKSRTNPWELLYEAMQGTAFTSHTYRHTTIGFEADIAAMPNMYAYSQQFFQRYYRPENVVIVVAGDIKMDDVLQRIRKHYGAWKPGYVAPAIPVEPQQRAERRTSVTYPGKSLPILSIAWKGERFDPSNQRMVAALLLGDLAFGESSELYKKLVVRERRLQALGPDFGMNRDPGLWSVYAMVRSADDVPAIEKEILATVEAFQKSPPDAKRLDALKRRLRYSFVMNLDTPDKVAGSLARLIAITGGFAAVEQLYAAYDRVTPQDVQEAARTWLVPQTRTIVTLTGRN